MTGGTDPDSLAAALGRIPSGLFVLTVRHGGRELGMLASWVQQCSFEPPQISLAINKERDVLELAESRCRVRTQRDSGGGESPGRATSEKGLKQVSRRSLASTSARRRLAAGIAVGARVPRLPRREPRGCGRPCAGNRTRRRRGHTPRRLSDCARAQEWVKVLSGDVTPWCR